jgi:hypothetical protein
MAVQTGANRRKKITTGFREDRSSEIRAKSKPKPIPRKNCSKRNWFTAISRASRERNDLIIYQDDGK